STPSMGSWIGSSIPAASCLVTGFPSLGSCQGLDPRNVQKSQLFDPAISAALGARTKSYKDSRSKYPGELRMRNVVPGAVGHKQSKWLERFLVQGIPDVSGRNHRFLFPALL